MNSVGGMNDLRGDFVWLHGSRRVAESAEENKPNGGRHSTENSEEPITISQHLLYEAKFYSGKICHELHQGPEAKLGGINLKLKWSLCAPPDAIQPYATSNSE
jgi:hypothetical protein